MKTSDRTRLLYGRQKLTDAVLVDGRHAPAKVTWEMNLRACAKPIVPPRKITLSGPAPPSWGVVLNPTDIG